MYKMKKVRKALLLIIFIVMMLVPYKKVNAHSVELDPDSLITFPSVAVGGNVKMIISSKVGDNYSLYYQYMEMNDSDYKQIKDLQSAIKAEKEKLDKELKPIETEGDNLKIAYTNAKKEYEDYAKQLGSGKTDEKLKELETKYKEATEKYNAKMKECNEKKKEYNNKVNETNNKMCELTPMYNEQNWKKAENREFNVDASGYSGEKAFSVWVKLIDSNNKISYDEAVLVVNGTKVESVKAIELNKNYLELSIGSSEELIATLNQDITKDSTVVWSSENEEIATVVDGKVTAKSLGTTTIYAKTADGKYSATCQVKVVEPTIDETQSDDSIAPGSLPKAGKDIMIMGTIVMMTIVAIIFYRKCFKYRDIK